MGYVGGEYGYRLLEGNECYSARGFPSNPILSGSAPNSSKKKLDDGKILSCFVFIVYKKFQPK